jgi:hypothetical protein
MGKKRRGQWRATPRAATPRPKRRAGRRRHTPRRRALSLRRPRAPGEKTLLDVAAHAPGTFALIVRALGLHYCRPLRATCTALRAAVDGAAEGGHLTFADEGAALAASMRGAARRCTDARQLELFARECFPLDAAAAATLFAEPWARLESLTFTNEGGVRPGAAAALAAAVGAGRLPRACALCLANSPVEAATVAALFASRWAALAHVRRRPGRRGPAGARDRGARCLCSRTSR